MKFNPVAISEVVRQIKDSISSDVILLAAAKTRSLEEVEAVIRAGVTHIGYNYIQEAIPIIQSIGTKAEWHMIGHLQRNKVKLVLPWIEMIHSVDSLRLAEDLHTEATKVGRVVDLLLQVNTSGEKSKFGVAVGAVTPPALAP